MASSVEESSVHSPDSTVSSLLTSCSADSHGPYSDSFIHYKDKLYSSASEALEAYIEDFNLSLTSPEVSTGKICIYQSTPKRVKCSRRCTQQNCAAGDFGQRRGLDALASPSGRQGEGDPDSVSLATDELLAAPADQSLPLVLHTPESRQQSSERNRQSLVMSHRYQTSSLCTGGGFSCKGSHRDSVGRRRDLYPPEGCDSTSSKGIWSLLSVKENCGLGNSYPRWLTSQKPELSVSGISSMPSFHYPAWLESYNLSSRSAERDGPSFHTGGTASSSSTLELPEKRHTVDPGDSDFFGDDGRDKAGESCSYNSPGSYFQLNNSFSRGPKKPFTEDQLERLTSKADRGLEGSAEEVSDALEEGGSPSTTAILGADRPWEDTPGAFKRPLRREDLEGPPTLPKAEIIHQFLEDCLKDKNKEDVFPGAQHHRPLEALKLALFELQSVQGSLSQTKTTEQKEEFEQLCEKAEAGLTLRDSELIAFRNTLTNLICQALHHLSRLKSLVEENSEERWSGGR